MKSFALKNVKSFRDSGEIELKPLTIFVGPNSSGKSSLMRFPVVLGQTFREDVVTPLLLNGFQVDYGDFDDVVFGHEGDSFGFSLCFDGQKLIEDYFEIFSMENESNFEKFSEFSEGKIYVEIFKEDILKIKKFSLSFDDQDFFELNFKNENRYSLKLINQGIGESFSIDQVEFDEFIPRITQEAFFQAVITKLNIADMSRKEVIRKTFELLLDKGLVMYKKNNKSLIFESLIEALHTRLDKDTIQDLKRYSELWINCEIGTTFLSLVLKYYLNFQKNMKYIGPFRISPERVYRFSETKILNVGNTGEHTITMLAQDTQKDGKLIEKVSKWFSKTMNCDIKITPINNSLFKVLVYNRERKNEIGENLIDVGVGIAHILPIVTQLYHDNQGNSNTQKTYVMEQPELHLHPAAQSSLAELFVEKVSQEPNSRILIETHSEHLLRKLQVLVSDPDVSITNNDVAIYYVEKNEDGSSSVQKMELNEKGQFVQEWPTGFFDKSYELAKELIRAAAKPRTT